MKILCVLTLLFSHAVHGWVVLPCPARAGSTLVMAQGKGKGGKGKDSGPFRVVAKNKQAFRNYEVGDRFEAGVELLGTEVKSCRGSKVSIDEAFARADKGECYLYGMHIAPHQGTSEFFQHEAKRPRRLLLHKKEIRKMQDLTARKGMTLVPLTLYFNHKNKLKLSLGLGTGKNVRDKRDDIKARDAKRTLQRAVKAF